jgi:hypothetical protein
MLQEKIWDNFQRILELFTQKIVTKLSKIWVWDPRSEIRKKPIPDPGSRGQKGTGSRIRIGNTGESTRDGSHRHNSDENLYILSAVESQRWFFARV